MEGFGFSVVFIALIAGLVLVGTCFSDETKHIEGYREGYCAAHGGVYVEDGVAIGLKRTYCLVDGKPLTTPKG